MSLHRTKLSWNRNQLEFAYKTYSRNHTWTFENGTEVKASAAEAYLGDPNCVDPEQAFVASLASCHMLTFLAIASMRKIVVESYDDEAIGHLEKAENGKMVISKVELYPKIRFSKDSEPDRPTLEKLHHLAHQECFLANTVNCEIITKLD